MSSINSFSTKWLEFGLVEWTNNYNKCDMYCYSFDTISEETFVSRDRHCPHPTCPIFDIYLFVTEIVGRNNSVCIPPNPRRVGI